MRSWSFLVLGVLLGVLPGCGGSREETPTSGQLRVVAAESHAALLELEAQEFQRLYARTSVVVEPATTREAIVELLNERVPMICSDRPLNAQEREVAAGAKLRISELRIAEDALAVLVHRENPIEHISLESLSGILSRQKTDWSQVPECSGRGPIELALTGRNSGAYELVTTHFFHLPAEPNPTVAAETQQAVFDYVSTHPAAIGLVSIPALRDSASSVRVLGLPSADSAATDPWAKLHQANVYREAYPLHYPVYIYTTSGAGVTAGFGAFVASAPGQKIILNAGLVPATMPVRLVYLKEE